MSTAEDQAAAALRASKSINEMQQVLTDESRRLLADLLEERMRVAVAEGISAAMTDDAAERFWNKGFEVLHQQAKVKAGDFVIGGLAHVVKKALWIAMFAAVVYSIGGWSLLKTIWAAMNRS